MKSGTGRLELCNKVEKISNIQAQVETTRKQLMVALWLFDEHYLQKEDNVFLFMQAKHPVTVL